MVISRPEFRIVDAFEWQPKIVARHIRLKIQLKTEVKAQCVYLDIK